MQRQNPQVTAVKSPQVTAVKSPQSIVLSILLAPIIFLSTLLSNLNHLSILNSIENGIDAVSGKLFKSFLRFDLEFEVHKTGMDLLWQIHI